MLQTKNLFCLFLSFLMLLTLFTPAMAEEVKYTSDTVQISVEYDKTHVTISNLANSFVGKTVVCCWYLDDVLVDVRFGTYLESGITLTSSVIDYDEVRYYLWEDEMNIKPLSSEPSISADNWVDTSSKMVTFSPDDFDEIRKSGGITQLAFYSANTAGSVRYALSSTPTILYNGVSLASTKITPSDIFGDSSSTHLISPSVSYPGVVRLIDDDASSGYDRMELEIGVPAVVDSVDTDGNVTFLNAPLLPYYRDNFFAQQRLGWLNINTAVTSLTKNGVTYDPSQVKAGDVLILKPNYDATTYAVEVLDASNYLSGYVTATRSNNEVKLSDGKWYSVAGNGYCVNGLEPGDAGRFYHYCNKLICFIESYSPPHYGYVMDAASMETTDNGSSVTMLVLNTDNKLYEVSLADTVMLHYLNHHDSALTQALSGDSSSDLFSIRTNRLTAVNADALAKAMTNKLVLYETNASGEVILITFGQSYDDEEDMYQEGVLNSTSSGSFRQANLRIGNVHLDENTIVFLIDDETTITYGDSTTPVYAGSSGVTSAQELTDGATYDYVAFDTGNDIAGAVVIMNVAAKTPADFAQSQPSVAAVTNHYGYIINSEVYEGTFGAMTVIAQILDQSGEVYVAALADFSTFKNLDAHNATLASSSDFTLNLASLNRVAANDLADTLRNKLVTYSSDADGHINSVTLPQSVDSAEPMYQTGTLNTAATAVYNDDTHIIDNIEIMPDTKVFHISNNLDNVVYGSSSDLADIDYCRIAGGNDLQSNSYQYLAFDNGKALVIMNHYAKLSPSSNVAVINSVGKTLLDGDKTYIVEYWMNGELMEAPCAVDLQTTFNTAVKGDVYQINVSAGIITAAEQIMDYNQRKPGEVVVNSKGVIDPSSNNGNGTYFGAITAISNSGKLTLSSGKVISSGDAQTANVYVFNPNIAKPKYQLYPSVIGEAYVNTDITNAIRRPISLTIDYADSDSADKTIAADSIDDIYELLDYAFAYVYEDDVIDIVVYKAYDFGYYYR